MRTKNLQPLWQHAISEANNISFETTLAQREQQIAIREESVKKYNEQQRQAQIIYAEKYKKDNENLKNTITGLAAIIVGGAIISDSRRNNSEDYSQYGDCAPKLKERLARCNVSSGECSMIGCSSKTDCFKGLAGRSCEFILNTYGRTYKTYYCDTNTSDYDTDRETVINKICEK